MIFGANCSSVFFFENQTEAVLWSVDSTLRRCLLAVWRVNGYCKGGALPRFIRDPQPVCNYCLLSVLSSWVFLGTESGRGRTAQVQYPWVGTGYDHYMVPPTCEWVLFNQVAQEGLIFPVDHQSSPETLLLSQANVSVVGQLQPEMASRTGACQG